jgi:glycogen(starch) synthase
MRIVLASQEFPPETAHGGIATQTHVKAHGLAELGNDVVVITHSTDEGRSDYQDGRVRVIRIPGSPRGIDLYTEPARWITYSTMVATEISKLHEEERIDLVDFPDYGAEGYVHLLNRTEFNHIPTVVHLHGPLVMLAETLGWPEPGSDLLVVGEQMEEYCFRRADLVISSSRCSATWIEKGYGIPSQDIPVVHSGVDTQLFRPMTVPRDERPTIVFVGKLSGNKGAGVLLDACLVLRRRYPDLLLRLIAPRDDVLERDLLSKVAQAGAEEMLELTGFVTHERLPTELNRADVFAAPSDYEGGPGFVYLEAMACGLPVVAAEGSGASEVVIPGISGMLVPPRDPGSLAYALDRLLSNRSERNALGKSARGFVEREAERDSQIARLEGIYRNLVQRTTVATGRDR